ncbi:hypothetical protein B4P00_11725 [Shewanella xiamenensis]|uniref:helix-turn-helix domain-containing protein n=1 Tax=Shewanella xiamenensis TaxID=332186 RepID=UPI001DBD9B5D|nr:LysR family transcriptional regulator [Shewanella xiamenensis]MBW0296901.1 hypothetical protein [Shewanella xiamenensis]
MRITLRQLMIFKAICTERQISKAAKLMHMSTPAVSMALKELENSLGCRLFERAGGGLELNAEESPDDLQINHQIRVEAHLVA